MTKQDNKELLIDTFSVKFSMTEDKNGKSVGRGVFARAGVPTANRRVYPESVWRKNINKLMKDIKERKTYGELDHPEDGKTKLQRVSHLMTDLKVESDGNIIGEMEIIPGTPNGAILQALVDANCTIGVSSRGYGSVKMNESGHDVVQDDYVLMTFDAVSDPANATSWPEFSKEGEAEESKQVDNKNVLTEVENKEEKTMVEQEQKSPKDAYKDMPIAPSPDPYEAVEVPKKYYGIFQKTDKEEYDFSVAKFIFTNKEDADEMAKKLTTDSETKDKSVFVAKEIDYSEILKKESKEIPSTQEEPKSDALKVNEDLEELKPWIGDIESIISDVAFYLKDAAGEEANKLRKIMNALKGVKAILGEMKEDNEKLTHAAKEMAFRYFLEKSLSHHPKYQEIVAGLGKLTKYESVEEIRSLIKVHVEEADDFVKTKQLQIEHRLQRMENELTMKTEEFNKAINSKERIVEAKEKEIKSMREEISRLSESLKEEQAKVYLEQRLQGNPNAHSIRKAVTESRIFDKRIVDNMVESMTQPVEVVTESTTFKQVRDSLARRQKLPVNNLVEGAVKGTTISDVKKLTEDSVNPLINQSMQEFRILAGLENK